MKTSALDLFSHAADRAKDVAVMMEAARALTVLGRSLALPSNELCACDPQQLFGLYETAERLGHHVRQMSSEARTLLVTAKHMLRAQPGVEDEVPLDFDDVCRLMDESMDSAVGAIDRLDAMRLTWVPSSGYVAEPVETTEEVQAFADNLFQRLRLRRAH
jgi:hypothetical protein